MVSGKKSQGLVFGRFYRSIDVKDLTGYGIGLYLVREVLSKQGGYVKIQSEYGKGTIVRLYFLRSCGIRQISEFITKLVSIPRYDS